MARDDRYSQAIAKFCRNNNLQRQKGFVYYIGKDGCLWAEPLKNNTKGKRHRVSPLKVPRSV